MARKASFSKICPECEERQTLVRYGVSPAGVPYYRCPCGARLKLIDGELLPVREKAAGTCGQCDKKALNLIKGKCKNCYSAELQRAKRAAKRATELPRPPTRAELAPMTADEFERMQGPAERAPRRNQRKNAKGNQDEARI